MSTALEISGLTKIYDNGFEALKGITLEVETGDFFALLGPNGAGKSTTLGVVCGLVEKTAGNVKVMGIDIDSAAYEARRQLGVVPQEFNFNQFEKVLDIVITQAGYFGLTKRQAMPTAEHLLKELDLWDKRDTPSRMLSGGMKRRLMIARALIHQPKLLILDEPTAGVDIELRRSMWAFMQRLNEQQGTTIILTTHYLEEAEQMCRNIGIINKGELIRRTSTKSLLAELSSESFILDLITPSQQPIELPSFDTKQIAPDQLRVTIQRGQNLNMIFEQLSQKDIHVRSLRTETNRLEELFVDMVKTA